MTLKERRKELKMSQAEMARVLGVSVNTYQRLEWKRRGGVLDDQTEDILRALKLRCFVVPEEDLASPFKVSEHIFNQSVKKGI